MTALATALGLVLLAVLMAVWLFIAFDSLNALLAGRAERRDARRRNQAHPRRGR